MLKLHTPEGRAVYLHPDAIAEVHQAGASSQWHGIRSIVRTFDKRFLELNESADEIARQLAVQKEQP